MVVVFIGAIALLIFALQGSSAPSGQSSNGNRQRLTVVAFTSVTIATNNERLLAILFPIPSTVILRPGETTAFGAVAFDQFGREIIGLTFIWRVGNQSVGTITSTGVFQAGQFEGEFLGAVILEVAPNTRFDTETVQEVVNITVQRNFSERVPSAIRLLPEIARAAPGQTVFLTALGLDSSGALLPSGRPTWSMADSRAGSVTSNGGFTAGDSIGSFPGAITVSLQSGRGEEVISGSLDVAVVNAASAGVGISVAVLPQTVVLSPGQQFDFDAIVIDLRNGSRVGGIPVEWQSSIPSARFVSAEGRFIAPLQPGSYPDAIEAIFDLSGLPNQESVATARSTVIVVEENRLSEANVPENQIFLLPQNITLSPGRSAKLEVAGLFNRPDSMEIDWEIDPNIGAFSEPGRVEAGANSGVYFRAIKAVVVLEYGGVLTTHELFADLVIQGPLATVKITPRNVTTNPGTRVQFFAQARDANGVQLFDVNFRWSVEDELAGTINNVGSFVATENLGEFTDSIKVVATQLVR